MPGVTGDRDNLYVTIDGDLKVYRKTTPLQLVRTEEVAAFQLGGPEVVGNDLYVSRGTHAWTADGEHVFMSTLNEGDAVRGFRKRTLSPTLTYGEAFVPQKTVIYDRRTAQPVFAIPDPLGIFGRLASPRLSVDPKYLFRTIPGCCGKLVEIFDAHTFEHIQDINRQAANTVTRRGRWLIVGDEFGTVSLWDVGPICQRDGGRLSMARHSKKSARVDGSGTFVAPTPLFKAVVLKRGRAVARNVAAWTRLECEGAEVAFREHWGGFVEIVCGDSRVMLCHCGVERLTRLPPESALAFLMKLLKAARAEQRNRVQVDLLSAVIERSIQSGRRTAPRQ